MKTPWAPNGPTAALLYFVLAVLSFIPQSLSPHDTVAYAGDSLESAYIVAWNVHAAFGAPALFEANVLHPLGDALAFTDHRLLPSLVVAPVLWATDNPVLAYNVAILLVSLLAAFGGRRLARVLGLPLGPAWVAGALYAFHTYQINEAPRLNIIAHGFLPFALAELLLYLETGERRRAFTAAGLMLLQGLSSNYHLLYGSLLVALVVALFLLRAPRATVRRLPWLLLATAVAALAFAPIALPYLRAAVAHDYTRELPLGVDAAHFVSTTPTNWIYGALGVDVRLQQQGPHFVGFASLALAALACFIWLGRRESTPGGGALSPRVWVPGAALLAATFFTLALGRDVAVFGLEVGPGPYRLLYEIVPGFQLVRIPERMALLAMLFVALLAARGLELLGARAPRLALALGLLVPLEHISPLPRSERVPVGDAVPAVYALLARTPLNAIAELPIRGEGLVREETYEMYFSTYHFKPLVGGYTAFPSLLTTVLRRFGAEFPAEASLQALGRVGVDTVVIHHGRPLGVDLRNQLNALGPAHSDELAPLLRRARLDLFDRLPAAVDAGHLEPLGVFRQPPLFQSDRDELYRIVSAGAPIEPAAMPRGNRRLDPRWRYRTKAGDPVPAVDQDMRSAWVVPRPLKGDEFFEVTFGRPIRVSGVVLRLGRDSVFPTRFRIGAQDLEGHWAEVARYDDTHALQLLDQLLAGGSAPAIGFDLGAREVLGLNILVEAGGTSHFGWKIPEIEVLVP